jgi:uncharacterized coiled-coil protein SlyX
MATYVFKEQDLASKKNITVVKTITQTVEFTMAEKEKELEDAQKQMAALQEKISALSVEITEARAALGITG